MKITALIVIFCFLSGHLHMTNPRLNAEFGTLADTVFNGDVMRTVIDEKGLRDWIIEQAMPPAKSAGANSIVHQLTITRRNTPNAAGANWDGVDRLGGKAMAAAIAGAQKKFDLK